MIRHCVRPYSAQKKKLDSEGRVLVLSASEWLLLYSNSIAWLFVSVATTAHFFRAFHHLNCLFPALLRIFHSGWKWSYYASLSVLCLMHLQAAQELQYAKLPMFLNFKNFLFSWAISKPLKNPGNLKKQLKHNKSSGHLIGIFTAQF